jgi:outer membrane lipoprotein SlyB
MFNQVRFVLGLSLLVLVVGSGWSTSALYAQYGSAQRIQYGVVVSVQKISIRQRSSGRGARTGGTVGAIAGAAVADRGDGLLGALIGGAIGGAIGRSSDRRRQSSIQGKELIIRLDNGEDILIETTDGAEYFKGDKVQVISSSRGTRVRRARR